MRKLLAFFALGALAFAEQSVWLNLNDKDIEGGYELNTQIGSQSKLFYGFEGLRAEDEFDEMQVAASAQALVIGATPLEGLSFALGFRATLAQIDLADDMTVFALPIKAGAIYAFPLSLQSHIGAFYSIAPKSLCFSDCDKYTEIRVELGIEPMEGGMIFAGWRKIEITPEHEKSRDKYEFNKAPYIGLRITF